MKNYHLSKTSLILFILLTGCANDPQTYITSTKPFTSTGCDTAVINNLVDAVEKSANNLQILRKMEQADWPELTATPKPPKESPLRKLVTISWNGPLEDAIKELATVAGYTTEVTGHPGPQTVMVTLNIQSEPLYKIVENIGWQAGPSVAVIRNDKQQLFKIIYSKG